MKVAPLLDRLRRQPRRCRPIFVHTGQHYDYRMSEVFFQALRMPVPDIQLSVGPGTQTEQTARIMLAFEGVLREQRPDLVIVVGDVNSTLACALVACKHTVPIAHVEAGLRSFDWTMPEEINRRLTDSISDYLFVSEPSGVENLQREGIDGQRVHFVGNVMIDTLLANMNHIDASTIVERVAPDGPLERGRYAVVTLHRPVNVDSAEALVEVLHILRAVAARMPAIYPMHPRTLNQIAACGLADAFSSVPHLVLAEPLGYVDFIKLVKESAIVLTDSGGLQEETTMLGVPCLTMRESTERPITITEGTNRLVHRDHAHVLAALERTLAATREQLRVPPLWDGKAALRIIDVLTGPLTKGRRASPPTRKLEAA